MYRVSCRQLQLRVRHGDVLTVTPASAADGRAVRTVRRDLAAGDGDIARRDEQTAADARAVVSAVGVDPAAVNVDIIGCGVAIHVLQRFPAAPADTGSSSPPVAKYRRRRCRYRGRGLELPPMPEPASPPFASILPE